MFNEKIVKYRKKNMLTQEELAEKLCVSRQTITKWEKGTILPGLEYLIDLSQIFGITIDHLIKDDDCISKNTNLSNPTALASFLIKAKGSTYAARQNRSESKRIDAHDYYFADNQYKYYDSFFGSSCFSEQEIVYENDKVCWSMNYYGKILGEQFNGDFLKEALLIIDDTLPLRGPEIYTKGEYTYTSHIVGNLDSFSGEEYIYYHSQKIYEGLFHGGRIQ